MLKIIICLAGTGVFFAAKIAVAEDPLLTEDFFDSPASEDNVNDSDFGSSPADDLMSPYPAEEKPSIPIFTKHSVNGGIGISSGYFALRGTVRSFFNEYFTWENAGFYRREMGEQDGKDYSLEFYGLDSAIVAQYPVAKLFLPFAGAGPGFEMWSQLYDEYEFDKSNSLNLTVFFGANINMTKNLILQLRYVTKNYLTDQPIKLSDRMTKQSRALSYVQVYFLVSI